MLILTARDVAGLLTMDDVFTAVREALATHVQGHSVTPPRHALHLPRTATEVLVMPAAAHEEAMAVKTWHRIDGGTAPGRPADALPSTGASVLLLDPTLGQEVLLDGSLLTDLRTGALSGVAAEQLAPPGSARLGVIGAGLQARTQITALAHALPELERVRVWSRTPQRLHAFVAGVQAELAGSGRELEVTATGDAREATDGADVVVAATTARSAVFEDAWLRDAALVCGVGSHDPEAAEIPAETVARAQVVVVDTLRGGLDGAGDVAGPVAAGLLRREDVVELGSLLTGAAPAPTATGLRVFKSVGFAGLDLAVARSLARRALDQGVGQRIDLHGLARSEESPRHE